jgi:hypothetical protein
VRDISSILEPRPIIQWAEMVEHIQSPLFQPVPLAFAALPFLPPLPDIEIHHFKTDYEMYQPICQVLRNHSIRSFVSYMPPTVLRIFLFTKFYI